MCILIRHTFWENIGEVIYTSDMNELYMKIPKKKQNKMEGFSITFSYIWPIDLSKCAY